MAAKFHPNIRLDLALIHYPVLNRNNEIIGSAVTNLDLHDIARAGRTFGVSNYWVVTADKQQQELAAQITGHWTEGYGGTVNPDRANALSLIRICDSLDTLLAELSDCKPLVVATSASRNVNEGKRISYSELRNKLVQGIPTLLLFGTAWGLAPEIMERVDLTLPSVHGPGEFNHLSVRSAASIILDRLIGTR